MQVSFFQLMLYIQQLIVFYMFLRATSGVSSDGLDIPNHGLVRDGTPCGDNLICINQTCTSIFPHIDQTKCPTNQNNAECSGHGVITITNVYLY